MDEYWLNGDSSEWPDELSELHRQAGYAQIILTVQDHAPLLANAQRARLMMATLDACRADVPGQLWGYVVLPDSVRIMVGPAHKRDLEAFITKVKTCSFERLLRTIRRSDDDSIDMVLRYNPVRGGVSYQVWVAGAHQLWTWSEYKLSNMLLEMLHTPVEAGLIDRADDWPYRWIGDDAGTI